MTRHARGTRVAVVITLALVIALAAETGAARTDDGIDITTELSISDPGFTPLPDNEPVYDVLWDLTHGVYLSYEPTGSYSSIVALLAANGYVTTTTTAGLNNIDLSPYEIIVIAVTSNWNSPYTAAEVQAIQNFVSQGGSILVMGENTNCPNANVNPVSQAFGVTCGAAALSSDYSTSFAVHPIFAGITSIYHPYGGALSVASPAVPVAWTYAGEPTVALVASCQVVVTGDCNFCDNNFIGYDDNQQFALNVFECLASGSSPAERSTWGAIKATYR